ncbi:MAG TPA: type II toxin-antitoxin system PemK/MazF family toxin [Coriobacteriia bacterium]|nr:type II toxin-antitoxin system PemK/MazF family toxin [Coriobacteriia bacterium]
MRGELWIAQADLYASKVRPVLVVQADNHDIYDSIVTCLLTSYANDKNSARIEIKPDDINNLKSTSFVMVDKIFSFDKADLDRCIGRLSDKDMAAVSDKMKAFLGL